MALGTACPPEANRTGPVSQEFVALQLQLQSAKQLRARPPPILVRVCHASLLWCCKQLGGWKETYRIMHAHEQQLAWGLPFHPPECHDWGQCGEASRTAANKLNKLLNQGRRPLRTRLSSGSRTSMSTPGRSHADTPRNMPQKVDKH